MKPNVIQLIKMCFVILVSNTDGSSKFLNKKSRIQKNEYFPELVAYGK